MSVRIRYTVKFMIGLLLLLGIIYFTYWLLDVYRVRNAFGLMAMGVFIGIPLLASIARIPAEVKILYLVWRSENPEEIERAAADLRDHWNS